MDYKVVYSHFVGYDIAHIIAASFQDIVVNNIFIILFTVNEF